MLSRVHQPNILELLTGRYCVYLIMSARILLMCSSNWDSRPCSRLLPFTFAEPLAHLCSRGGILRSTMAAYQPGRRALSICHALSPHTRFWQPSLLQPFHTSKVSSTDGVYQDLTNMRVRKPWVQALREQKETSTQLETTKSSTSNRDLRPKKMSDSYHRVV